jgi:hypothetical protein
MSRTCSTVMHHSGDALEEPVVRAGPNEHGVPRGVPALWFRIVHLFNHPARVAGQLRGGAGRGDAALGLRGGRLLSERETGKSVSHTKTVHRRTTTKGQTYRARCERLLQTGRRPQQPLAQSAALTALSVFCRHAARQTAPAVS